MQKHEISIHTTSNSKILKFESNLFLTNYESFEFSNIDEAKGSPLAQQLFYLPFVKKVYISSNFVAIERYDIVQWDDVQEEIRDQIESYLNSDGIVVQKETKSKKAVTVYAETTPNPAVLKFVANKNLVAQYFEFSSIEDAKLSPFATELFQFPFVKSIFIDKNYVSIAKYDIIEWEEIMHEVREFIRAYIEKDKKILQDKAVQTLKKSTAQLEQNFNSLDDTSKDIVSILEEHIKPAVATDGGNIQFDSYDPETKTVKVILQGACSGCPSSTLTLKNGIEATLKEFLKDKVGSVVAVNG